MFPESTNNLCAWHIVNNLKKRFLHLNRSKVATKKTLYNLVTNLPYCKYEEHYIKNYNIILNSKDITNEDKEYLEGKNEEKIAWSKCYVKKSFTCGMISSSRIECKHKVYKRFLDSDTRLSKLFLVFQTLEEEEINNFNDEFERTESFNKDQDSALNQDNLIKQCLGVYCNYVVAKLKMNVVFSNNYHVTRKRNAW